MLIMLSVSRCCRTNKNYLMCLYFRLAVVSAGNLQPISLSGTFNKVFGKLTAVYLKNS